MCGAVPAALLATGLQAANTIKQSKIDSKQAKANAAEASQQAIEAQQDAKRDLASLRRKQSAELAKRRVAFAKSGVRMAGSPLATLGKLDSEFDEEAYEIKERGKRAARGLRLDAASAKRKGISSRIGAATSVGNSLLRDPNIWSEQEG